MRLSASRRLLLPLLFSVWLSGNHVVAAVSTADPVVAAIERAVHARVGRDARVEVSDVAVRPALLESATLAATPDPAARVGGPVRFVLTAAAPGRPRARVGEATASIRVTAPAVRVTRPVARGALLESGDVQAVSDDLTGRPFRALPGMGEVVGSRARRDLETGVLVMRADIAAEPLIRAGQVVRALVHVADVEVVGQLVAVDKGMVKGDLIRVVNPDTHHALRARVIGNGEVEVVNVP